MPFLFYIFDRPKNRGPIAVAPYFFSIKKSKKKGDPFVFAITEKRLPPTGVLFFCRLEKGRWSHPFF
jgi:hypothetical protein